MASFYSLMLKVLRSRYLIWVMSLRDIKLRYTGSALGLFWTILHPAIMVTLYWFIFSLGLKIQPSGEVPFVVWFFCAFTPWTTFSDTLTAMTSSIVSNSALIKRTLFPSEIFPFIYILSHVLGHVIMLSILVLLMFLNGLSLSVYTLQVFYYWFAMSCFLVGLGWICSAINVIFRDMGQFIGVLLQIWFWSTPIIWVVEMVPSKFQAFLYLNPMYYITQGYRETFLFHRFFWEDLNPLIIFWGQTVLIFLIGGLIFRKFKREFADTL
ncbi:ABC transporter permease [Deltaproteobacteria bacterium TL4]